MNHWHELERRIDLTTLLCLLPKLRMLVDLPLFPLITPVCCRHGDNFIFTVKGKAVPEVFQEVKVPRFHDNGTGWW
jgi:hypothetical protein